MPGIFYQEGGQQFFKTFSPAYALHICHLNGRYKANIQFVNGYTPPQHGRIQNIPATHGYEKTSWFFRTVLCVFMINQKNMIDKRLAERSFSPKTCINYFQKGIYGFNINEL